MPQPPEAGICRRQQIGACVGKRSVKIKDNRAHSVTIREAATPCGLPFSR
jgi:hypothetical protein